MRNTIYFRPEWTCGRFNKEHQVALMYNLITGMSYLFEDESAEVIGEVLLAPKNRMINIEAVALHTQIAMESLLPFIDNIVEIGLLTTEIPDIKRIEMYRKAVGVERKKNALMQSWDSNDIAQNISSAERDYFDKVGGITNVMFELTYRCSENCIHCYNPGATRNDDEVNKRADRIELGLNDYKRIIDELYDLGLTKICLSGGDPFNKPSIWDIIEYLYSKDIAIDIFTNGQRLIDKVQRLANYYPHVVGISLYSGKEEEHDYITRLKGSWRHSMKVITQLSELGIPTHIKCCIMQPNIKGYHIVKDIAERYGALPQFSVCIVNSLEGDRCAGIHLRLPPNLLEIVLRDKDLPLYIDSETETSCEIPRCDSFCITPEGYVQTCCMFPSTFGDLKEMTFGQILQSSKELQWWRNVNQKDYAECGKHPYCDYCKPCPGINYTETGSPLKPAETNCYIAKLRYDLAYKLKQGYDPLNGKSVQEYLLTTASPLCSLKQESRNNYRNKKMIIDG
jgi:MoaA/NifB/PqqE/SkfB family radical SAM enzyme